MLFRPKGCKIEQGITRLIDSYAEGFVQKSEFEPRITRLRQRLADLEQHEKQIVAEEISRAQLQMAICRLEEFHEKVKEGLNEADWQMRRDLIRTLVKRVEIGKDEVKVIFRIPPDLDHSASTEKSLQDCRGSVSPVLANLFMHYAFDEWMRREHPNNPWARYADDGVIHCRTQKEAENLLIELGERFKECKLELNSEKTRIVYCKDDDRRGNYPVTSFDFLGYTFRARRSKNRWGKCFINFSPAVSNAASKAMRQTIRGWRMQLKSDVEIDDLSRMFNPVDTRLD